MRRTLLAAVRPALGIALLALVLWKAGASSVLEALRATDLRLFALALLLYGGCQLLSSLRWALLLRGLGAQASVARLFALYLVGMFFNQLLPGSISGDLVKLGALRTVHAAISILLDRLLGLLALLALGGVAALAGARVDARLGAGGALLLGVAAAALFTLVRVPLRRPVLQGAQAALRALPPRSLAAPLAASAGVQLGNWLVYLLLARALGLPAGAGAVLALYVATTLAAVLPISVGGLGVREMVGAAVFGEAGLAPGGAVALALLWTASATLWSLLGGALFAARRDLFDQRSGPP